MSTPNLKIGRHRERGKSDFATIARILDEALVVHVGFEEEGFPYVIPMAFGRKGEKLYLHGSAQSRILQRLSAGVPACVTATMLDGLVLARSAFAHSMNYRSVVIVGTPKPVIERREKVEALRIISDHLLPGRWEAVRPPSEEELTLTSVVSIDLRQASAKVRSGPPKDAKADYALPVWAGEIPIRMISEKPVPDPALEGSPIPPEHVKEYRMKRVD